MKIDYDTLNHKIRAKLTKASKQVAILNASKFKDAM